MKSIEISKTTLDHYVNFFSRLNKETKKELIIRLIQSIDAEPEHNVDISHLSGAWESDESSDEIIAKIRASRVEKSDAEVF